MNIARAIENLKAAKRDAGMVPDEEWLPTLNLAIEALKRVKEARKKVYFTARSLLPGETKEN